MPTLKQFFGVLCLCSSVSYAANPHHFASGEHFLLGNQIKLFFSANDPGQSNVDLHLPNGLSLSYGDILAFGDLYGTPDHPISYGKTPDEQNKLSIAAFDTFARDSNHKEEANQLVNIIVKEAKTVELGVKSGEKEEDIYKEIGEATNIAFNCATGGGCNSTTWWAEPGRYLTLLKTNYDHFGDDAVKSYLIGHHLALNEAYLAHQLQDPSLLQIAYAMNAFASHFLSDRFSAGHIRTPRYQLAKQVTPDTIGSLLANFMHNEESSNGIHVHNARGDKWIAYGDESYFNPNNKMNQDMIRETLQLSVNEVFKTYQTGVMQPDDEVLALIPYADEMGKNYVSDISTLFYWDSSKNKVARRNTTSNVYDRHFTTDWWGWTTLIQLTKERGLPSSMQQQLAASSLAKEALADGLITDKNIIALIKARAN
jgi:hypothetical protein